MNSIELRNDPTIQRSFKQYTDSVGEFTSPDYTVTEKSVAQVSDTLKAIKLSIKEIIARRKEITQPLDESKAVAMRQEKDLVEPMKLIEDQLKIKLGVYLEEVRKFQEEEERKLRQQEIDRAEAEKQEILEQAILNESEVALDDAIEIDEKIEDLKTAPIIAKRSAVSTTFSGVHTRKVKKWKVVDKSKIPAQYFILNEKLIGANVRGGIEEIDGIKIWITNDVISK